MSLVLTREALSNQIADDLATRNENYGLIESAVGDLESADSAIKGTGWTDENLVDHETRIGATEKSLLTTKLAVNELERQSQIGNGATLDFDDIGIVPLDARATGRANPTVEGRTATNIVDGAGIANLGTVTFASVLNHKYFDVLHGTILTGTGSDMTVTNDTGATVDIAVIYLTGVYGAGNEPTASDCAKLFSYFDGTKSIQLPARIISKSEDESETSTLYLADNEEVRSVPAIADQAKPINGEWKKVQNVQRYVLQASDIFSVGSGTYTQHVGITKQPDYIGYGNYDDELWLSGDIPTRNAVGVYDAIENVDSIGYGYDLTAVRLLLALGTYASLSEARADLAGTVIYYQLATPITTNLTTIGALKAFQNGSVYYEPYYEGSHQTDASSQITLPYEGTIDAVYGYDENLDEYLLDSSEYSLVGTTLTITGATENEVFYVQMSRSEPLAPEMSVNVINNAEVAEDSVTGKFYKKTFTVADGIPTFGIEEVV